MAEWQFDMRRQPTVPPLAWVAAVRPRRVTVDCGESVRTFDGGLVEGTWVGSADPAQLPESTTVFGSGMVVRDGNLFAVPPTHHLECIYYARTSEAVAVSNSLVGLLAATGLELDPAVNYPGRFLESVRSVWMIDEPRDGRLRLRHQRFEIPTTTVPITGWFVENLLITPDLTVEASRRPREAPFASFADYKARITAATASLIANGAPYKPVVALSAGYDSTAVAAVVAAAAPGQVSAVGFATARPPRGSTQEGDDSGAAAAAVLGMPFTTYERGAYKSRDDLAEAELLASGMAGEDTVLLSLEPALERAMLINGYWGGPEFAFSTRDAYQKVAPITTSGAGITEYRLRADFAWVPLPLFGAIRTLDAPNLLDRSEMDPFRVGGHYDRPIPRRLIEEAGIKRGTFAQAKRAATALPPRDGFTVFSPATRQSIERFVAGQQGKVAWRRRRPFSPVERAIVRTGRRLRLQRLTGALERRQTALTHFEPRLGNVLLRWAVSVVSQRYAAVRTLLDDR